MILRTLVGAYFYKKYSLYSGVEVWRVTESRVYYSPCVCVYACITEVKEYEMGSEQN